ncbi:hypothetical protein V6V47_07575 [Micromonospora sp. CPCC 205539]|uniref:hypothetical protein n=1 Tax=Micromonospora sp. CPCC 205539 TaxID=3122408 RepID=UPI002FF21E08
MPVRPLGARLPAVLATSVLAALLATGCGQDDDPSVTPPPTTAAPTAAATASAPPASPTPSAAASTPAVDQQITVTITKRQVAPPTGRVTVGKGELVRITVTSDTPDELHVHGYDLGVRLPAGKPASVEFRAEKTGLFEVETHESGLVLFQLVVR